MIVFTVRFCNLYFSVLKSFWWYEHSVTRISFALQGFERVFTIFRLFQLQVYSAAFCISVCQNRCQSRSWNYYHKLNLLICHILQEMLAHLVWVARLECHGESEHFIPTRIVVGIYSCIGKHLPSTSRHCKFFVAMRHNDLIHKLWCWWSSLGWLTLRPCSDLLHDPASREASEKHPNDSAPRIPLLENERPAVQISGAAEARLRVN